MSRMVKAIPSICRMCKYRAAVPNEVCDYWNITKRSRVFEDGKLAYDPAYCDKFERGKRIEPDKSLFIRPREQWPLNPWQE